MRPYDVQNLLSEICFWEFVTVTGTRLQNQVAVVTGASRGIGRASALALAAEGAKVVVLEDVVTTGGSALKAVDRLREAGYQVDRVLSVVDRQQGGAELYAQHGLAFEALFSIADVQAHYAARSA